MSQISRPSFTFGITYLVLSFSSLRISHSYCPQSPGAALEDEAYARQDSRETGELESLETSRPVTSYKEANSRHG